MIVIDSAALTALAPRCRDCDADRGVSLRWHTASMLGCDALVCASCCSIQSGGMLLDDGDLADLRRAAHTVAMRTRIGAAIEASGVGLVQALGEHRRAGHGRQNGARP